ncbi:MAG TPA: type II toxin-antitoxin system HicA family toxin [bacterium]|nr:type II toxin-antitoxin system HicA family toxin [bacterium]
MTSREVELLLKRRGYQLVSQRGSHRKWRHPASGLQVIVPEHRGRKLPIATLHNILTNAEIPETEWRPE